MIFISLFFNVVVFEYENINIIELTYIDYIELIFEMDKSVDININVKILLFCYIFSLLSSFCVIIHILLLTFGGKEWKNNTLRTHEKRPYGKYITPIILIVFTFLCLIYHLLVFDYFSSESGVGLGFYAFLIGAIACITLSILDTNLISIELELKKLIWNKN